MIFPRYKAKNYELKCRIAFEFSKPLLERLMNASMESKVSDDDFKKCKELIIEGGISLAEQILKKASEK